jgi:hypothetical protein
MASQLDHIIIAVPNIHEGRESYAKLGFKSFIGKKEPDLPRINALISFQDGTYLELIAPGKPDEPLDERWQAYLADGGGFNNYAIFAADLEAEDARLRGYGLDVSDPIHMGRVRPDDKETTWRIIRVNRNGEPAQPFLISDDTPRNIRVQDGDDAVHPNGVTKVIGLVFVTNTFEDTVSFYRDLYENAGIDVTSGYDEAAQAIRFTIGAQWVDVIEPKPGTELDTYLALKGSRPYELVFGAPSLNGVEGIQSLELSHNARLRFVVD